MKQIKIFCWNSKHFTIICLMLAISSRVPRPFMKPACSGESSRSMWGLRRSFIMCNKILLACGIKAMVRWFLHSLASPFLGRVRKTDFFQSFGQILDFQTLLHTFCKIIATESSACFKSSPGMSSIPGAFWFVNFLMASWTSDRRISGSTSPQGGNSSDVSLVSSWDVYRFSQSFYFITLI